MLVLQVLPCLRYGECAGQLSSNHSWKISWSIDQCTTEGKIQLDLKSSIHTSLFALSALRWWRKVKFPSQPRLMPDKVRSSQVANDPAQTTMLGGQRTQDTSKLSKPDCLAATSQHLLQKVHCGSRSSGIGTLAWVVGISTFHGFKPGIMMGHVRDGGTRE